MKGLGGVTIETLEAYGQPPREIEIGEFYLFSQLWDGAGEGDVLLESGAIFVYYTGIDEYGEEVRCGAVVDFVIDNDGNNMFDEDSPENTTMIRVTDITDQGEI